MNDVFISYSRHDKEFVQKLYEALTSASRAVWADWDSIPAASDWFTEIKQGIEETDAVIFVLSPEWVKSNECRKEMNYAVEMGKRLFPILYIPVDPKDVPPELSKINWVYMRDTEDDFDKAFQMLCDAMDTDLEWIKTHSRIQVRALEWDKKNRSTSFALRGEDLTEGERFLANGATKNPVPTLLQSEYVIASRKDATRRQRQTLVGVTVALVVSIALAVVAAFQWQKAIEQARISHIGELMAQSISLIDRDFQKSLLLAIEVYREDPNVRTKGTLLDVANANPQLRKIITPPNSTSDIDFSPDGKTFASSSYDGTITLWDAQTGLLIKQLHSENIIYIDSITYNSDGKFLAAGGCSELDPSGFCKKSEINLWNIITQESIGIEYPPGFLIVADLIFSPDSKFLLSITSSDLVLWNLETKPITHESFNKPEGIIPNSIAFSPDGKSIAIGDSDGKVSLFSVENLKNFIPIGKPFLHDEGSLITDVSYSPDGETLVSLSNSGNLTFWNVITGQPTENQLKVHLTSSSVNFSPDGRLIASGNTDGTINLWDAETMQSVVETLKGNAGIVNHIAFSPDSKTLASLSENTIIFWDTDISDQPRIAKLLKKT